MSPSTVVDPAHIPALVNGLSLEVARQADRIRRRSHSSDWPGAASAMTEMEETVELMSGLVTAGMRASFAQRAEPEVEPADDEVAVSVGQYL
ncbi:hypothetical protein [Actinospongicola halichondriae]|uniref:hypothetical protein n=1 Tax=Actinospongicola halichondriae TaxID=3236844 RepID=UPI003D4C5046